LLPSRGLRPVVERFAFRQVAIGQNGGLEIPTKALIELCRWELERLRQIRLDVRASIETSRKLCLSQVQPFTPRCPAETLQKRAEEATVLASGLKDEEAKRLLLEIAEGYAELAENSPTGDEEQAGPRAA